jgi:hypothetical protein
MAKKKEPVGAIARVNNEMLERAKERFAALIEKASEYGLPFAEAVAIASGLPSPFASFGAAALRFGVDEMVNNRTEDAELRALTYVSCVAHSTQNGKAYKTITPERLRSLYQRLTKRAVDLRQEDRIRYVVAATLGGSDAEIASTDDLIAAEWMEAAEDSKLKFLSEVGPELFGPELLPEIVRSPASWPHSKPVTPFFSPCLEAFGESAGTRLVERAYWWPKADLSNKLIEAIHDEWIQTNPHECKVMRGTKGTYRNWPSPLFQRVHNAFIRSKQMMEFDLKQAAETAKVAKK